MPGVLEDQRGWFCVWGGDLSTRELRAYMRARPDGDETWTSGFRENLGGAFYDHDRVVAETGRRPRTIAEILAPWDLPVLLARVRAASTERFRSFIIAVDVRGRPPLARRLFAGGKLRYLGSWSADPPARGDVVPSSPAMRRRIVTAVHRNWHDAVKRYSDATIRRKFGGPAVRPLLPRPSDWADLERECGPIAPELRTFFTVLSARPVMPGTVVLRVTSEHLHAVVWLYRSLRSQGWPKNKIPVEAAADGGYWCATRDGPGCPVDLLQRPAGSRKWRTVETYPSFLEFVERER